MDRARRLHIQAQRRYRGILLILLLGFSVTIVWTARNSLQVEQKVSDVSYDSNEKIGDKGGNVEKLKRFWKYYQTYRYIPSASRYDYIPVPEKECGDGPNFNPWWKLSQYDRSRNKEDTFIYETFFKNETVANFTGTYVELGAFNGRQESNTRFFDLCLGWKGLLIEGNPENYQKTIENRPFAHKMSLAPSCSAEYEATNKTIQFFRYPMTNAGLVGHAKSYTGKPTVDVPCGPLSPILKDIFADHRSDGANLPTVDFFSLDVEGSEDLVLSTIDFKAIRINILMIEIHNNFCTNDDCVVRRQVRAKMAAEGYTLYKILVRGSDIYVHPDSPFKISKSIAIPAVAE